MRIIMSETGQNLRSTDMLTCGRPITISIFWIFSLDHALKFHVHLNSLYSCTIRYALCIKELREVMTSDTPEVGSGPRRHLGDIKVCNKSHRS